MKNQILISLIFLSSVLTINAQSVLTDQTTPQIIGTTGARLAKLWTTDLTSGTGTFETSTTTRSLNLFTAGSTGNYSHNNYCNIEASPTLNGFPGTQFLVGQDASDLQVTLNVAPLFSSSGANKQAYLGVCSNKNVNASGAGILIMGVYPGMTTIRSQIQAQYTLSSPPINICPGGPEVIRFSPFGYTAIQNTNPTSNFQVSQFASNQFSISFGTVSTTAGSTTVIGAGGTRFVNMFRKGLPITVNGETRIVSSVNSDTNLTTDAWTNSNSNAQYSVWGQDIFSVKGRGQVGILTFEPTAYLHIGRTGTATAGTAPLKFTPSGAVLNTTPEIGAFEPVGDDISYTIVTGAARKLFVFADSTNLTNNYIPVAHTNGRLINSTIYDNGNIGIGTTSTTGAKLTVKGKIVASEIQVKEIGNIPDYVFKPGYQLMSLNKVEDFVKQNQHLPEVPSEKEFKKDGMNMAEMNALLLKKVEELTLYAIEQNKKIESLEKTVNNLLSK